MEILINHESSSIQFVRYWKMHSLAGYLLYFKENDPNVSGDEVVEYFQDIADYASRKITLALLAGKIE